jgi:hypothetical protein
MFARQKHADFRVLSFLFKPLYFIRKIAQHIFAFAGQFHQGLQILEVSGKLGIRLDIFLQTTACLQNRLSFFLVVPEFRAGYPLFKLENLRTFAVCIKDTLGSVVFFPRPRSP